MFGKIKTVVDFVSGVTDLFILDLYRKITGRSYPGSDSFSEIQIGAKHFCIPSGNETLFKFSCKMKQKPILFVFIPNKRKQ